MNQLPQLRRLGVRALRALKPIGCTVSWWVPSFTSSFSSLRKGECAMVPVPKCLALYLDSSAVGQATCPFSILSGPHIQRGALHRRASCLQACHRELRQDWCGGRRLAALRSSQSASQSASCLLLGIPQLGSVPWAQPLLSCPLPDADAGTALGSGLRLMLQCLLSLGRSWKTPTRCSEMGVGLRKHD